MSFFEASQNIRIDDGHILRAQLRNGDGQFVDSEIDLDQFIGNNNGQFQWDSSGFSGSAENVTVSIEGAANVLVMRATLRTADGQTNPTDLNLGERIVNDNGQFKYE